MICRQGPHTLVKLSRQRHTAEQCSPAAESARSADVSPSLAATDGVAEEWKRRACKAEDCLTEARARGDALQQRLDQVLRQ